MKRSFDTGSITPAKPKGRLGVYDLAIIAPLVKQCVDVARALQNMADAPPIRRFLVSKGISPASSERWIMDHKKARGVTTVKIKFKPKIKGVMMVERQDVGELVIAFNKDPAFLVGSYDESNFGGEGPVPPNRTFEVYPEDVASIPDTARFAPRDWEDQDPDGGRGWR